MVYAIFFILTCLFVHLLRIETTQLEKVIFVREFTLLFFKFGYRIWQDPESYSTVKYMFI